MFSIKGVYTYSSYGYGSSKVPFGHLGMLEHDWSELMIPCVSGWELSKVIVDDALFLVCVYVNGSFILTQFPLRASFLRTNFEH